MAKKPIGRVAVEPAIPATHEFSTIPRIRAAINELDEGSFYRAALLIERQLWNPRLRAAISTRLNGLIATQIRWEPARENAAGRRAARDIKADWPHMAPSPQRQQLGKWGLLLGFGLAQRMPIDSPESQRQIFRLKPYWPGWARWQWYRDVYRVQVRSEADVDVQSPSETLARGSAASTPWIVHEPFGEHSWREGLVHAAWRSIFGHDTAYRDLNRASEKYGIGALKFKYPADKTDDAQETKTGLRNMHSEPVIPLPQYEASDASAAGGFDVEPLEFAGGGGFEIIDRALNAASLSLAILILGHNLTTEVKGGSYAAAGVGEFIRSDIKSSDAEAEWATLRAQLVMPWAELNYGDPELAPRAIYVTDPPTVNQQTAQTYAQLAQCCEVLARMGADVPALLERFQIPLKAPGEGATVQVATEIDAEGVQSAAAAEPETEGEASVSTPAAEATLAITPTDLASIVTVDEGRKSVGLTPVGGDAGGKWIREHAAQVAAEVGAPTDGSAPSAPATPVEDDNADDGDEEKPE